jgi:RNA polymerase sigma factor (sigma-70 family)
MGNTPETGCDDKGLRHASAAVNPAGLQRWFVEKILPLEAQLTLFLRRNWRNQSDIPDLVHDVYVRIYEAASKNLPDNPKSFLFSTAHNMLIDRVRRDKIVPIEFASQLDAFGAALDEPGPDRNAMARDDLRRLQKALDDLPPRTRAVVVLRRVDGLSRSDIARQLGISEVTIKWHLNEGLRALADALYGEQPDLRGRR